MCVFLFACTKKNFLNKGKEKTYAATIIRKEVLSVSCRDWKDEKDNIVIQVWKNNCDTIKINGIALLNRKPLQKRHYWYLIAPNGDGQVDFTATEILLLDKTKNIVDSLNWCKTGNNMNFRNWKMIGTKTYL